MQPSAEAAVAPRLPDRLQRRKLHGTGGDDMDPSDLGATLRSSKFFRGFTDEDLQGLAEICQLQDIPARSTVFQEFDRARKVYIILSGEVSLAICDAEESCRQIAVVHAGELMGWSPLVGRARLYDSARSLTAVKALVFDGDA